VGQWKRDARPGQLLFDGDRLRSVRLDVGLTAAQLAERIGRDVTAVYAFENGRSWPRADVIGRLADELGVGVDDLFTRQ
jgi:transcriptional regulator with XRE-family HTH domain